MGETYVLHPPVRLPRPGKRIERLDKGTEADYVVCLFFAGVVPRELDNFTAAACSVVCTQQPSTQSLSAFALASNP